MLTERRIHQLPGGSLGSLEWGDPAGAPALYLHGTPSSAVEAFWLHQAADRAGVRLVSIDRPGYLTSSAAEPGFDSTAARCAELVDELSWERFAVIGFSGGAGYALAVASRCKERVSCVHIGGGMGSVKDAPADELPTTRRLQLQLMGRCKPAFRVMAGRMSAAKRSKLERALKIPMYAALEMLGGSASGAQLAALDAFVRETPPEDLRDFVAGYAEAHSCIDAVHNDFLSISRPWPFALSETTVPVHLWHGTVDDAVPVAVARRLASSLPQGTFHELDAESHFVFLTHGDEVCESIRTLSHGASARRG